MEVSKSRLEATPNYPILVYMEAFMIFSGANFLFHQNVFRRKGNRFQFGAFMMVNIFTSFTIAETMSQDAIAYYANCYNNSKEVAHRAKVQELLRLKMFSKFQKQ